MSLRVLKYLLSYNSLCVLIFSDLRLETRAGPGAFPWPVMVGTGQMRTGSDVSNNNKLASD